MIGIEAIAVHHPGPAVRVSALAELDDLADVDRQTCLGLGVDTVRDAGDQAPAELAAEACRQAMGQAGVDADEVDALLLAGSRAPEYLVASEATRVQQLAGLRRAVALTVTDLGCVSSSAALLMARALLCAQTSWQRVLFACGSRPAGARRFRRPVSVNGDAGLAVLLSRSPRIELLDVLLETDGRCWDLFKVEFRGRSPAEWEEVCTDVPTYSMRLAIESRNRLADLNARLLERNGMSREDVDHFVMQNISAGALGFYEQGLGCALRPRLRREPAPLRAPGAGRHPAQPEHRYGERRVPDGRRGRGPPARSSSTSSRRDVRSRSSAPSPSSARSSRAGGRDGTRSTRAAPIRCSRRTGCPAPRQRLHRGPGIDHRGPAGRLLPIPRADHAVHAHRRRGGRAVRGHRGNHRGAGDRLPAGGGDQGSSPGQGGSASCSTSARGEPPASPEPPRSMRGPGPDARADQRGARLGCDHMHLDSGTGLDRRAAHRLHLDKRFRISAHHFSRILR